MLRALNQVTNLLGCQVTVHRALPPQSHRNTVNENASLMMEETDALTSNTWKRRINLSIIRRQNDATTRQAHQKIVASTDASPKVSYRPIRILWNLPKASVVQSGISMARPVCQTAGILFLLRLKPMATYIYMYIRTFRHIEESLLMKIYI